MMNSIIRSCVIRRSVCHYHHQHDHHDHHCHFTTHKAAQYSRLASISFRRQMIYLIDYLYI